MNYFISHHEQITDRRQLARATHKYYRSFSTVGIELGNSEYARTLIPAGGFPGRSQRSKVTF
jgi:hypothetical protein